MSGYDDAKWAHAEDRDGLLEAAHVRIAELEGVIDLLVAHAEPNRRRFESWLYYSLAEPQRNEIEYSLARLGR